MAEVAPRATSAEHRHHTSGVLAFPWNEIQSRPDYRIAFGRDPLAGFMKLVMSTFDAKTDENGSS
ncbi:hypothetical protein [Burkholderia pseudomultivorans]|uniref:hypothetical protein n=1 Tax=Burkholderia pseudomultivorans TaxID=1207504 RepID=UPI0012D9BA99|nr:hypothetical protein [Burkholderia pseudomultivorans]